MVDGVNKRRQSRLPKEDPRTLSQVGGDIQQGLGNVLRGAMSTGEFVAENPRLVGETLVRGASYAVPGSSTAEFVGMAPELTSNELAPGVMDLIREGKYGEAASLAAFLGLDLAQLSGVATVPATLIKGGRGLAKGIGELADIAEQQRLLSIESGGPPIGGGGDIPRAKVPTRKDLADIGKDIGEAKKAGNEELFQSLKAQQAEMKARFDEANPKPQKVERPKTSPQSIIRLQDSEYVEETGQYIDMPSTKVRANVLNGIETIPADQGTGKQFLRGIREGGVSEGELLNSGLGSFLQQNMDRLLTKEQVREEYIKYAPQIRTRDMGAAFWDEQRIMPDESVNYTVMRFENNNPNVGNNPELMEKATRVNTAGAHFGVAGDIGYVRMADLGSENVPGAEPNKTFVLVNEVQDDLSKTRSRMDAAKKLPARYDERDALAPAYIRETKKVGQEHLKVLDEALDELNRIDPEGRKYSALFKQFDDVRESLKTGIQSASDYTTATVLDRRLETSVRDKMFVFAETKSLQDDGFSPEVAKRVSDLVSNNYTADPAFAKARTQFKQAQRSVDNAEESEDIVEDIFQELTPDMHRKLESPETKALFKTVDDARQVLVNSENKLQSAIRSQRDLGAVKENVKMLEADLKAQERVLQEAQKKLDEASTATQEDRLRRIELEVGVTGAQSGVSRIRRDLEGARETVREIRAENPFIYRQIGDAKKVRDEAQAKLDVAVETLKAKDPELAKINDSQLLPNRIGNSEETHRFMFDTLLEETISNGSKSGIILPSPEIIADIRGAEASSFEPIYGQMAKRSVEDFKKRYPNVDVRTIKQAGHPLDGSTVITFPNPYQRSAEEVLTHKYAQGGMVYKGIGSMGREVL